MTCPTPATFRRRLRRLDDEALARFVAALWAAAGWSTAVREGRIVARRRDPASERRVIAVAAGPAAVTGALVRPPRDVDLLVAPAGERTGRVLAARTELPVVAAADLHERLTYGVADEARERLLAEFLPDDAVPEDPVTSTRRALLSSLAVGFGVGGSGAVAPRYRLDGVPPTGTKFFLQETAGGVAGPGHTAAGATSPARPCWTDPRETVAVQVERLGAADRNRDRGDVGEAVVEDPALTEAFVDATTSAGARPLFHARSVRVGAALGDEDQTRVPVTVTALDGTVVYEFTLVRSEAGCWRTVGARIVDGRTAE